MNITKTHQGTEKIMRKDKNNQSIESSPFKVALTAYAVAG
jgi:hypothetical protein